LESEEDTPEEEADSSIRSDLMKEYEQSPLTERQIVILNIFNNIMNMNHPNR